MKVDFFVQIYLDLDFPHLPTEESWIRNRIAFFERFTLPSLKAQTVQDFRVVLLCGRRFKAITSAHKWDPKVEISYQMGRDIFKNSLADWISITRIDSDDLFHKEAIEDVKRNILLSPDRRECLIFRHSWAWDMPNRYLLPRLRQSPPFYTHIFPKGIFRNWQYFSSLHFVGHGKAGGRDPGTRVLPEGRVVVTKTDWNVGLFRRGVAHERFNDREKRLE